MPRIASHALLVLALGTLTAGCYADTANLQKPGGISFAYRTHDYPEAFSSGSPSWGGSSPSAVGGGPRNHASHGASGR